MEKAKGYAINKTISKIYMWGKKNFFFILFGLSLECGAVPLIWDSANVSPIFKKGISCCQLQAYFSYMYLVQCHGTHHMLKFSYADGCVTYSMVSKRDVL